MELRFALFSEDRMASLKARAERSVRVTLERVAIVS